MPTVEVVDLRKQKVEDLELSDVVFDAPFNGGLLHQVLTAHRANQRAGTHKTKNRAEVAGAGRKPWRQKGTGRARVGSRRSPLWRGGGTTFGPRPRSYAQRLPRKMQLAALRIALSDRLRSDRLTVVQDFVLQSHRTREFRAVLEALGAEGKVLLVDNAENVNLERSSRNLPNVRLMRSSELHAYSVLGHARLVISADAARRCSEVLA